MNADAPRHPAGAAGGAVLPALALADAAPRVTLGPWETTPALCLDERRDLAASVPDRAPQLAIPAPPTSFQLALLGLFGLGAANLSRLAWRGSGTPAGHLIAEYHASPLGAPRVLDRGYGPVAALFVPDAGVVAPAGGFNLPGLSERLRAGTRCWHAQPRGPPLAPRFA